MGAMRMNAENVLKDIIRRKKDQLRSFEILLNIIPWKHLSIEDEEKLWNYFSFRQN